MRRNNQSLGGTNYWGTPSTTAQPKYKYYRKDVIFNTWKEISKADMIERLSNCLNWDCKIEDILEEMHKHPGEVGAVTGWARYKAEKV